MADLPCPTCGSPLSFLEQYQRYYCLRCGQYAPEGYGDRGARRCPTCGGILSFVTQYGRFYCYHCNTYAPDEPMAPVKAEAPAVAPPATDATPAAVAAAVPEAKPAPAPAETTLVAAATPAPTALVAQPLSEPSPAPVAQPESKPPSAEAAPATAPQPARPENPAEPVPPEPSKEIQALAASKPAIVRVKIFALKKPELMDLCKAYSLDPSGTKEQVQERLLSYLHSLEVEEQPEAETEGPPQTGAPAIERHPEPTPVPELASKRPIESSASGAAAATAMLQVEQPAAQPAEPVAGEPVSEPAPSVAEVPKAPAKVEHPCPTCARELTYVSQYDRYYCYYCQRYAPTVQAKGACPTCGATMRWIDQHQRWWCDSCQKYAPADLPKPARAAVARTVAAATTSVAGRPAIVLHHHASPAMGMGLIGAGLALWVIYEFFAVLNPTLNLGINNPFDATLGAFMVFLAFLLLAAGAMVGLSSLRDRI